MDVLRELVLPKLDGLKKAGSGFSARCPAHDDAKASLMVGPGRDQAVVLHCHAGCAPEAVAEAMGLTLADLSNAHDTSSQPAGEWTPAGPAVAVYDYRDEAGALLFQVLRTADKEFRQRIPDRAAKSGWTWKLGSTRRVIYRLQEVIQAIKDGRPIWIVEGEKDVHALEQGNHVATCNPGGAGKWLPTMADVFREADVTIVADKDAPGQAHARAVATSLDEVAVRVRIVEAAAGKDARDHLNAGYDTTDFVEIWNSETPWEDDHTDPDVWEFLRTGDPEYDWVVPHLLERGDRLMLTGYEGLGKALDVSTPIPTPKGWVAMGNLVPGDEVFGPDGKPARVVAVTETMTGRPCYRVRFSDDAEIVADASHQWVTETLPAREAASRVARRSAVTKLRGTDQGYKRVHFPAIVTTEQIAATIHARGGHALNHSIQTCSPLQYPAQEQPVPAYLLGIWLGDGTSRFGEITCADPEVVERIAALGEPIKKKMDSPYGWRLSNGRGGRRAESVQARLRRLGVLGNKHIPASYLYASTDQRLELLRGLMDSDGTVNQQTDGISSCEFSVCDERLATDVLELLHGLGIKVAMHAGPATLNGRHVGTRWRLPFQTDLPVFHLPRKAERLVPLRTRRARLRYITAVEPIASVPVRCIQVDREDGMFVAGRKCIPTHNSMLSRQLAVMIAAGLHPWTYEEIPPHKVLLIDCENSERQSRRKFAELAPLSIKYQRRVPDRGLILIHRPAGIDLTRDEDTAWLRERAWAHRPDVLVIGPFYRLHMGDMNEEAPARRVVGVLDSIRARFGCALIIEAHSGHGDGGRNRSVRPVGSSLLLRWCEFGYGLCNVTDDGSVCDLKPWRGPRDEREFPKRLTWGGRGRWPWISASGGPA